MILSITFEIPSRYGITHMIIPGKHVFRLIQHRFHFFLSKRNSPAYSAECIARDIKRQQLPEFQWHIAVKVSVYHTGCKNGRFLGTPYDMILSRLVDTFFSRISLTMPPAPKSHNTAYVLPWEEPLHWQSRSSGYSSS